MTEMYEFSSGSGLRLVDPGEPQRDPAFAGIARWARMVAQAPGDLQAALRSFALPQVVLGSFPGTADRSRAVVHDRTGARHDACAGRRPGASGGAPGDLRRHQLGGLQDSSNRRLNTLTIRSAIYLPPTLIAGIYGMNLQHIPMTELPHGYLVVMLIMVLTAAGQLWFFYRHGRLE